MTESDSAGTAAKRSQPLARGYHRHQPNQEAPTQTSGLAYNTEGSETTLDLLINGGYCDVAEGQTPLLSPLTHPFCARL